MSLVSVIIPAYNAVDYVGDAIEAALAQTHSNLEVVVVDDGSTDDTAATIRSFGDSRIRFIGQPNSGQSAAINRGVAESTGSYIKLLDADDWINPEHIRSQLDALDGRHDAVASCRWGYFLNDFQLPAVRKEVTNNSYEDPLEWIIDSLTLDEGMMGGWMWLIPRRVWDDAGGYDPRLSLNNDFHFSLSVLLASTAVCYAPGAVYRYRKGVSGALSGSYGRSAMESAFLTTELGIQALLARENSERTRRIGADRFQSWLFKFFPEYSDLAQQAEDRIRQLGGSKLKLTGGRLQRAMTPLLGWKNVRRLQALAYHLGWNAVLQKKAKQRLKALETPE